MIDRTLPAGICAPRSGLRAENAREASRMLGLLAVIDRLLGQAAAPPVLQNAHLPADLWDEMLRAGRRKVVAELGAMGIAVEG